MSVIFIIRIKYDCWHQQNKKMNKNFEFYEKILENDNKNDKLWDLVVISAINKSQKLCFEKQHSSRTEASQQAIIKLQIKTYKRHMD